MEGEETVVWNVWQMAHNLHPVGQTRFDYSYQKLFHCHVGFTMDLEKPWTHPLIWTLVGLRKAVETTTAGQDSTRSPLIAIYVAWHLNLITGVRQLLCSLHVGHCYMSIRLCPEDTQTHWHTVLRQKLHLSHFFDLITWFSQLWRNTKTADLKLFSRLDSRALIVTGHVPAERAESMARDI